ncbi:MAG: hypothetical protein R2941_14400 [Desulfobacterales bacterium]
MQQILIVEDEIKIARLLRDYLVNASLHNILPGSRGYGHIPW